MTLPAQGALQALADPMRQRILLLLSKRPHSVQELASQLPVTRPAVSHHLGVLKGARLVEVEKAGTRNVYRVEREGAEALQAFIDSVWGDALIRFKLVAENLTTDPKPEEPT